MHYLSLKILKLGMPHREQAFVKISNEHLERHTDKFTGKANECTCDSVSFFSSLSSCSVFCSLTFIISSSFSRLLFSCSVMPGFDSTVTAPTDLMGAEDANSPFIFLEYSSWRLVTWDITYSWLTNDLAQQGHWNKEDEESSKKKEIYEGKWPGQVVGRKVVTSWRE